MNNLSDYISKEQQEEFEQFLLGKMTEEQAWGFMKKLEDNPELNSRFIEFKKMFKAVEENAMRQKMEKFHSETEYKATENKPVRYFRKYNYIIAASIALLIIVGGSYLFFSNTRSNKVLYKKYYSPDPGLPTVMGVNNDYEFYRAMVDYKQGKYDAAIKVWENLSKNKSHNDTLNYFLGAAYLANGNENKAVTFLDKVIAEEQSFFYGDAQFYLGLITLQKGKIQQAKAHFELSQTDRSEEILEQLKD